MSILKLYTAFKSKDANVMNVNELLKNKKIVLIEDELDIAEFLNAELEFNGAQVSVFDNFESAIQYFKSNSVDLLITDLNVGNKTATDFIRDNIRNKFFSSFVIITGSYEVNAAELFELGAKAVLIKPFAVTSFLNACAKAILPKDQSFAKLENEFNPGHTNPITNLGELKFAEPISDLQEQIAFGNSGFYVSEELLPKSSDYLNSQIYKLELNFNSPKQDLRLGLFVKQVWKKEFLEMQNFLGLEILSVFTDNINELMKLLDGPNREAYIPTPNKVVYAKDPSRNSKSRLG